jgi:hypothetical protein
MRAITIIIVIISFSFLANAQILDDSTKQIYNIKTVNYLLEDDLLKNKPNIYNPDTTIKDFYKTDRITKSNWLYQDLGNIGTASKPLFFIPKFDISTQSGYNIYELYAPDLNKIKYFNTKSPYTSLQYIQSNRGYSHIDFTHSQNINPRLNFTFNLSKYNSSKQIDGRTTEDKLVDHWSYDLGSNYISKNKKYQFLGLFYHFNHLQNEQGGILKKDSLGIQPDQILAGSYSTNYQGQLIDLVYNRERWNNLHVYHQYKLKNGFQVFHVLDIKRQKNFYRDNSFSTNKLTAAYNITDPKILKIDTLKRNDTLTLNQLFRSYNNKFGLKGRYRGFDYRAHIRQRLYERIDLLNSKNSLSLKNEVFAGLQTAIYLKDSTNNIIVETELSTKVAFYLMAEVNYKGLKGYFYQSAMPPSMFFDKYNNGKINWDSTKFNNQNYNQIKASYLLNIGKIAFEPVVTNTIYGNYIYLDQKLKPKQKDSPFTVLNLETNFSYFGKKFSIKNQSIFTINSDTLVYRAPRFINNTNVEFKLKYAKVLNLYAGFDVFFKTQYLADAYSPLLQQFYLQDKFKVWGYPVIDPYVSFNVNKVRLSLKFGNVSKGLFVNGFYTTPYYLVMQRSFMLKVDWPLFD